MTTGILIKNAMNEANLTQKTLQSITGIDQHILSDYINDKKSPKMDELNKIALATNKTLLDFIPLQNLTISHNKYADSSSSIQNLYFFDKNLIMDTLKKNIELEFKNEQLLQKIKELELNLSKK